MGFVIGIPWGLWLIHISGLIQTNTKIKLTLILAHLTFVAIAPWSTIILFDAGLLSGALTIALLISDYIG